jgi:hypothetical protein
MTANGLEVVDGPSWRLTAPLRRQCGGNQRRMLDDLESVLALTNKRAGEVAGVLEEA